MIDRRRGAPRERAELFFLLYFQQGAARSIVRLQAELNAMGMRVSVATLKRHSSKFRWQERAAQLDADASRQHDQRSVEGVLAMNERHAQLARALQGAGGSALQRLLANDSRLGGLRASDIARLVELGLKAERSAVTASSDRREIAGEIWNDVVTSVVQIFNDINDEPEPTVRGKRFALHIDRLVDERLAEVAERGD